MISSHRLLACAAVAALLLGSCSSRDPQPTPSPFITDRPLGASPADPRTALVHLEVEALNTTLDAALTRVTEAAEAVDVGSLRVLAADAVMILTADPASIDLDGDGAVSELPAPLFPGPAEALGDDEVYPDLLNRALTAARDASSARVIDALRDPVAGDLGAWQGDAGGMLTAIKQAAAEAGAAPDLDTSTAAVLELEGEAVRALTWVLAIFETDDLEAMKAFASRAAVHLDLVLEVVGDL